jgi:hypothetical protein
MGWRGPFAVACFVAAVWLNQGDSLARYQTHAAEAAADPSVFSLERLRLPFRFAYRRSADEELYYATANAIRGRPADTALLLDKRGQTPEPFQRFPPADGAWHRPYAEVPLEYPAPMLPFILAPSFLAASFDGYGPIFGVLMAAALLCAGWVAINARPGAPVTSPAFQPKDVAARWWTFAALLLAQGGLAVQRLDAVPALFIALGFWATVRKRAFAGGLAFGLAAAAKLVPIVLVPLVIAADRASFAERRTRVRFGGGLGAGLVLGLGPMIALAPGALGQVLGYHAQRSLHMESTMGTLLGLARLVSGQRVPAVLSHGSFNLEGGAADVLTLLTSPLLALGISALCVFLGRAKAATDEEMRADRIALALLGGSAIVWLCGKVFSPQYLTWGIPLVVAIPGRARMGIATVAVFVMAITQLYLRGYYDAVVAQSAPGVLTLVVRQAGIALLAWLVVRALAEQKRVMA